MFPRQIPRTSIIVVSLITLFLISVPSIKAMETVVVDQEMNMSSRDNEPDSEQATDDDDNEMDDEDDGPHEDEDCEKDDNKKIKSSYAKMFIINVFIFTGILLLIIIAYLKYRKKRHKETPDEEEPADVKKTW